MAQRLAVLIDGENVCGDFADEIFARVNLLGVAPVRRVYGDFSNGSLKGWTGMVAKHGVIPQQVFHNEKNAADIALIIDAMDMLPSGRLDGFCIVSSDSDFAALATRIREKGLNAYGFHRGQKLEAWRESYTALFRLDDAPQIQDDRMAIALTKAIQQASRDGWASFSELGKHLHARDHDHTTLSKLLRATSGFDIDWKKSRIKLAS